MCDRWVAHISLPLCLFLCYSSFAGIMLKFVVLFVHRSSPLGIFAWLIAALLFLVKCWGEVFRCDDAFILVTGRIPLHCARARLHIHRIDGILVFAKESIHSEWVLCVFYFPLIGSLPYYAAIVTLQNIFSTEMCLLLIKWFVRANLCVFLFIWFYYGTLLGGYHIYRIRMLTLQLFYSKNFEFFSFLAKSKYLVRFFFSGE